jgi:hypothetical protein
MPIVGGLGIHRKQVTFGYLGTETGVVKRGQVAPADRAHLRSWLVRFAGRGGVAFAVEGCQGPRPRLRPGHACYAAVKEREDGKLAAVSAARKVLGQACRILAEPGGDALTAA